MRPFGRKEDPAAGLSREDWTVRAKAIDSLAERGDASAIAELVAALEDIHVYVRICAAEALGRIADQSTVEPLGVALRDSDYEVREAAAMALAQIGDPAIEALVAVHEDRELELSTRTNATRALGKIGGRAVEPLARALQAGQWGPAQAAAAALGDIGDPAAVEALIATFPVEGAAQSRAVIDALANIGAPAVDALIQALADERLGVRVDAADALGRIGDTRAIEPLKELLGDPNEVMGMAAAEALESLGHKSL